MERCPNCGAPARPGAKFCTTCGYRLPAAAVVPTADPAETSRDSAASWPAPPEPTPATEVDASDQSSASVPDTAPAGADDVVIPGPGSDSGLSDETETTVTIEGDEATAASTDEVLSSSWPSTPATEGPRAWTINVREESEGERSDRESVDGAGVSEETVVVSEPASQYEGWSSAVVEEIAPPSTTAGTNIARANALLDELRLLLPALSAASTSADADDSLAGALETAVASARAAAEDRQALRKALNEARDNPQHIQTMLALSAQVDAAIALLDKHERLIDAVERAINESKPRASGIYPSSS